MQDSKNDTTIDPNELFAQFSPSLYFDAPQKRDDSITATIDQADNIGHNGTTDSLSQAPCWYTLIEQDVPASSETFWKTVVRQTKTTHCVDGLIFCFLRDGGQLNLTL
jgi:hypothetical protein